MAKISNHNIVTMLKAVIVQPHCLLFSHLSLSVFVVVVFWVAMVQPTYYHCFQHRHYVMVRDFGH